MKDSNEGGEALCKSGDETAIEDGIGFQASPPKQKSVRMDYKGKNERGEREGAVKGGSATTEGEERSRPRIDLTKFRVGTERAQGNHIHSSTLWTQGIPKM